jgi:hypothetical protein
MSPYRHRLDLYPLHVLPASVFPPLYGVASDRDSLATSRRPSSSQPCPRIDATLRRMDERASSSCRWLANQARRVVSSRSSHVLEVLVERQVHCLTRSSSRTQTLDGTDAHCVFLFLRSFCTPSVAALARAPVDIVSSLFCAVLLPPHLGRSEFDWG